MANIIVVGPHPDDQELGMGGTIARLAEQGHDVLLLDMTDGEPTPHGSREMRAREAGRSFYTLGKSLYYPYKNILASFMVLLRRPR